jgi:hypothetical protein
VSTIAGNPDEGFNDDPVAREVAWTAIAKLNTTAPSHELVRDRRGRWAFRATRGYTLTGLMIVIVLLAFPLGILVISELDGGFRSLVPVGGEALFLVIAGIAFALALLAAVMLVQDTLPAVIDPRRRYAWRSRARPRVPRIAEERWAVRFDQIHALQLLRLRQGTDVHELNVVLHTGRRLHVIAQGGSLARDTHRIAELIGAPVWEAPAIPAGRDDLPESDRFKHRKQRYLAARAREIGEPVTFGRDMADHLMSPSGAVLVLANLGPLIGVVILDWTVLSVFAIYWFENVIVGSFGLIRFFLVIPGSEAGWRAKLFVVPFFVIHYGMFVLLHGWLVVSLFGRTTVVTTGLLDLGPLITFVMQPPIVYTVQALALSHAVAFIWNYLKHQEYAQVDLGRLMLAPYARVGLLHIVLLMCALAVQQLTPHGIGLVVLISVKIAGDLWAHMMEHARLLMAEIRVVEGRGMAAA